MGKIYKVKTGKDAKANISEALAATDTDTLEVPQEALSLNIQTGVEVEIKNEKK